MPERVLDHMEQQKFLEAVHAAVSALPALKDLIAKGTLRVVVVQTEARERKWEATGSADTDTLPLEVPEDIFIGLNVRGQDAEQAVKAALRGANMPITSMTLAVPGYNTYTFASNVVDKMRTTLRWG
jgi:hypothetical protein